MIVTSSYRVRVDAHLDPHLSRWLWLVKWILTIPHYVVLLFLWIAFAVTSVIAFFAILFTGRYPARLHVPYPEHLSRGLVLVKWWLLALPHYLIVGIFAGGGAWLATRSDTRTYSWTAGGLIGLLVLIAAIVLAVTGRYPRGLYDFILGLNRWVLRVAAYTPLMTDAYPPFRLDTGGTDPGTAVIAPPVQDMA